MKKMIVAGKYMGLLIVLGFVAAVGSASGQAKLIDKIEETQINNDFKYRAEMWGDEIKDDKGNMQGFKNCRIKIFVKNISGADIKRWKFEARASRNPKPDGSYESIDSTQGQLMADKDRFRGSFNFDSYCYMKKDSIRITKLQ